MAEIKDKVVTVESLSALHEYNKIAYMPNWTDLGATPYQHNPSEFIGFVVEFEDEANNEISYMMFTDKTSNSLTLDTKAKAFKFDANANLLLYELYFYWGDGGYMLDATITQFAVTTGETTHSLMPYTKIYGIRKV